MVGCFVYFFIRIFNEPSFTFFSSANYCSFWMVYYKSMFYFIMTSQLAIALNRFICVTSPIEYHKRYLKKQRPEVSYEPILRYPNDAAKLSLFYQISALISLLTFTIVLLDQVFNITFRIFFKFQLLIKLNVRVLGASNLYWETFSGVARDHIGKDFPSPLRFCIIIAGPFLVTLPPVVIYYKIIKVQTKQQTKKICFMSEQETSSKPMQGVASEESERKRRRRSNLLSAR